jgi:dihydrofolate reductase
MRKVILLMHVSLDGFVAGPNGEMDWIKLDDSLWDYVNTITAAADTALYGAKTYSLMENYWPTAAEQPHATKHDIDHGQWANKVQKLVFSKSLKETDWQNTTIIRNDIAEEIAKLKEQSGKNLLMLGSPKLAQSFMKLGLIDEFRLNVNPVVIGAGISLFHDVQQPINLALMGTTTFDTGVVGLHYETISTR